MADSFSSVVRAMDEPISDPACLPLHLLCNSIKERVTVVLSGEGADELMGGYNQYMHTLNSLGAETNLLDAFKKFSWYFLEKPSLLKAGYQSPDSLHSFDHYFARRGTLDGMLAYDMKTWLPENLMAKADKITMSHSLEGRFPFLSKSIAEFCFSLPNEYKVENGVGKKILRRAFENDIPDNVIQRPKMGFSVPIDGLLLELRERLNGNVKLLANSGLADVLEMEVVEAEIEKYYAGESNDSLWIWTIAVLLEWFSQLNSGELFNSKRN
jgi:asparagine synthase (glutamine-hydrolysing)